MIAKLKPYPAMKDSGVEWLGEVPQHWEVLRLGNLFRERGEVNTDGSVQEVLSVLRDRGVIPYVEKGNIGNKRSEDITRYKIVRPDDIVVNCMNVIIGSVGLSRYTGCLSPVYYVLTRRSENDDPRYLSAYFETKPFQKSLVRIGNGILSHRMRIPMELLKCELFPRPPLLEQTAIVRYLDYVGRRVRQFVKAKQRLIGLLEEQKQAIIHRAVTRGLDPDAPLKDSGVEWLGKVPAHWRVRRLRNIANMRASNVDKLVKEGEMPVRLCNYVDVYKNDCVDAQMDFMRATATDEEIKRFRLAKGDVLITKDSEVWDDIGVPALVTNPAPDLVSGYHLALLRPFVGKIAGEYLFRALQSKGLAYQFHVKAKGVTRYGLAHSDIKSVWLPLPPLSEQIAIAEYLDGITANIDATIARTRREIELLQEYHTRLTADAVTGKLDVRDAAANLPDEPDKPEPIRKAAAATDGEKPDAPYQPKKAHQNRDSS